MKTKSTFQNLMRRAAMMMLLAVMTTAAWADQSGNWTYYSGAGKCTITGYTGNKNVSTVVVPKTLNGLTVVSITSDVFKECNDLKTLVFYEDTQLEYMPDMRNHTNFTTVRLINDSEETVSENILPASITSLDDAFRGTGIITLTLPNVTSISDYAFEGCNSLESVTFEKPASIGMYAFSCINNTKKTTVIYPGPMENWHWRNYQGSGSLVVEGTYNGKKWYCGWGGNGWIDRREVYTASCLYWTLDSDGNMNIDCIPMDIVLENYLSKQRLFECFWPKDKIKTITMNHVYDIEDKAFVACLNLTTVNVSSDLHKIGEDAFNICTNLKDFYFNGTGTQWNSVTKVNEWNSGHHSTYKEHWRCTVSFDANGHGSAPAEQSNLWSNEAKVTRPADLSADGWLFTGWYTDAACTTPWNFDNVVPDDMTLYAGWAEVLGSSYTLEVPEQVTIAPNEEWTTVTVDLTALEMHLMANGKTPQYLRLIFNYGTLTNQADGSKTIPFRLATTDDERDRYQWMKDMTETGQRQFRIHISNANWNAATPGTYSGTVSYTARWRYDNNTWSGDLESGTLPVMVTIPEPLYDDRDNTATIIALEADGQPHNVVLQGRTLHKNGKWNTLCLPFAMTAEQVTQQLAPAAVVTLESADFNATTGVLTLNFTDATSIEAGKPYLIKWTAGDNVTNPVITGVIVSNDAPTPIFSADGKVSFTGTYSPVTFEAGSKNRLYIDDDNNFCWPKEASYTLNSFRAYFELSGIGVNELSDVVNNVGLNFEGETTGIVNVNDNETLRYENDNYWYSLDGRKLSEKPTAKGVYIHNGIKVVMK